MKKVKIISGLFILALMTGFLVSQTVNQLESLSAYSDGKNINLKWTTNSDIESNLGFFEIERSPLNQNNFKYIGTEKAKGYSSNYNFTDDNALLKDDTNNPQSKTSFSYRIKLVKKDGKYEYSPNVNVVHNVSGIQRTWGMIKEMFK